MLIFFLWLHLFQRKRQLQMFSIFVHFQHIFSGKQKKISIITINHVHVRMHCRNSNRNSESSLFQRLAEFSCNLQHIFILILSRNKKKEFLFILEYIHRQFSMQRKIFHTNHFQYKLSIFDIEHKSQRKQDKYFRQNEDLMICRLTAFFHHINNDSSIINRIPEV